MGALWLKDTGLADLAFEPFRPRAPWWGGDLQTLSNFFRPSPARIERFPQERLYLPLADGSGDWLAAMLGRPAETPASPLPLVILIHGLSGTEASFYMICTAAHLLALGYPVLRLNLRGAGPSRPVCRLLYHAGRTEDLACAIAALPKGLTGHGVAVIGYSLGGNMLLKYLGETGAASSVRAAVSVSAPLDLMATSRRMMRRRNLFYQQYLLRSMKREALAPSAELTAAERRAIRRAPSIWMFDHDFTAPRNGYAGAEDYYRRNSSAFFLDGIAAPTLVVQALDDPWIPPEPYRRYDWRRNPSLMPLLPEQGGHVGFIGSGRRIPWHDLVIARFLGALFDRGDQPALRRCAASTAE